MSVVRVEREGGVAVVTIENPPVNATSHAVRTGLMEAVRAIDADARITAAVIRGAGKLFVAGADIREFDRPLEDPQMPEVVAAIVASAKPFVAALHGHALGGGFELALGCDARVAAPGTRVGLPEVTLGMIPGAGGTQHVPRLAGIAAAIDLICSGRRIPAEEALALGLIDAIETGDLREGAIAKARALAGKRRVRDLPVRPEPAEAIEAAEARARSAGPDTRIDAAIEMIHMAATAPYPIALAREREIFQKLRASPEAAELRRRFLGS